MDVVFFFLPSPPQGLSDAVTPIQSFHCIDFFFFFPPTANGVCPPVPWLSVCRGEDGGRRTEPRADLLPLVHQLMWFKSVCAAVAGSFI